MAQQQEQLIDGLIATYRDLNHLIRPIDESKLAARGQDGSSVREIVRQLRDNELRLSQSIKERLTGVSLPEELEDDAPIVGTESEDDPTRVILSQFGTARESTLAMLRGMAPDEWNSLAMGERTILARIERVLENDRDVMERITRSLDLVPA